MTGERFTMNPVRSLLATLATVALLLAGALVSSTPATAVTGADFNPGHIVSDAVFYDAGAMNEGQIQAFIDTKGARCSATAGNTCLKNYRETTNLIPADTYCKAYQGAPSESAAQIIAKVAAACAINPQVLLVTLQKEQGLVTSTAGKPAATYRRAFGYGCPDNVGGWCDPSYSGFFVQIQRAARQFQVYKARPTSYSYVAGRVNTILRHPNAACGTDQVFIQNQATAALYIYTPYVPNAAALSAGYGTGDSCSSYGNRNFFLYFSDWFGSTGLVLSPFIWDWYQVPANRAAAGEITTQPIGVAGGIRQGFQSGSVYVAGSAGIHLVPAGLLALYYDSLNGPSGPLAFPTGAHSYPAGGLSQPFQNGTMFVSGVTGFNYVSGWMLDIYRSNGGPTGRLGFPTNLASTNSGGITQSFQAGTVWISGVGGIQTLAPTIQDAYISFGGPAGALGFPTGASVTDGGVTSQSFQNGAIFTDGNTSGYVAGWMLDIFRSYGGPSGSLGLPIGAQRIEGGGIVQTFQNATVYVSGVGGIQTVPTALQTAYAAVKGPNGALGFPTGAATSTGAVTSQPFQGGVLYSDGAGAAYVAHGMMADVYRARGGATGDLGLPVDNTRIVGGGIVQTFRNGSVYISGSGGIQTIPRGSLAEMYFQSLGGPTGVLGWPSATQSVEAGGIVQRFTGGTMYISGATGFSYTTGWMGDIYQQRGGPSGALGFPTDIARVEAGGIIQSFQGGTVYIAGSTGIQTVPPQIQTAFAGTGGVSGPLGFPVAAAVVTPIDTSQEFWNGTVTVTSAGTVTVTLK